MSTRTGGLAIFSIAVFGLGVAAILALDRVGAPDRLVRSVGPILLLVGLALIGIGARNADLAAYLAAKRQLGPSYGALYVVAVAGGLTSCLDPGFAASPAELWLGLMFGVALGAVGFGPLVRRFGAAWHSDVIVTRFPAAFVRVASAAVIWSTAALTAFAGFRCAVTATAAVAPDRMRAEAIVAAVVALSVVPGGLTGVIWSAAAGAAAISIVIAVGATFGLGMGAPSLGSGATLLASSLSSPSSFAVVLATSLAVAGFVAFEPAAVASPTARAAASAGFRGVALCFALAVVATVAASPLSMSLGPVGSNSVGASLTGAAALAAALALASVGVHGSARAFGVALTGPQRPFPVLASVRLARMRAAQLIVLVACAACDHESLLEPRTALTAALGMSLALTLPVLALAAIPRAGALSAAAAMCAALAVGYAHLATLHPTDAAAVFETALVAAGAAFVAGALVSLIAPRSGQAPAPGRFDPFAAASG